MEQWNSRSVPSFHRSKNEDSRTISDHIPGETQNFIKILQHVSWIFSIRFLNNTSDSFLVVSGMSLRNSRNKGCLQVSGNRCTHSRNNRLYGHRSKTVRSIA